mmetsp:Transcript_66111/g.155653  ORF Transcript_66111/g.155653 Transcript_66111/m.155653 type:complete len:229 (+) Transcript_66111:124-810(+)
MAGRRSSPGAIEVCMPLTRTRYRPSMPRSKSATCKSVRASGSSRPWTTAFAGQPPCDATAGGCLLARMRPGTVCTASDKLLLQLSFLESLVRGSKRTAHLTSLHPLAFWPIGLTPCRSWLGVDLQGLRAPAKRVTTGVRCLQRRWSNAWRCGWNLCVPQRRATRRLLGLCLSCRRWSLLCSRACRQRPSCLRLQLLSPERQTRLLEPQLVMALIQASCRRETRATCRE